ncbi:MAG: sensor histidine kinase [Hyphomicrobiales bacterium]|nr:sensor histidine kinase [Hyphomicrobiales bacterium]
MRGDASLKRRLIVWLLGPLALLSAAMLAEVYFSARRAADDVYDRVLKGSALAIAERVVVGEDGGLEVDVPYVALEMLTSAAQDRVFYRVDGPGGRFITGYSDLPSLPDGRTLTAGQSDVFDSRFRGAAIRVVAQAGVAAASRSSMSFTVLVAETTQAREALAREMLLGSAGRLAAIIALAAVIVWFGVRRGLRPLARLETALHRRSSSDLRPVRHQVPSEVRHLVTAINQLMARLEEAIDALGRFTGNAGHQIRTPLAAIKAQVQLALGETDPAAKDAALRGAETAARETERLVDQLLLLARVDAKAGAVGGHGAVDLNAMAQKTTRALVPDALKKGIDLGFESEGGEVLVDGDGALLSEALKNLIENATGYCPEGSTVTVRVGNGHGRAVLEVEDNGPGIPDPQRDKALERFVRLTAANDQGTGLGLAIVHEIAKQHGAGVALEDGPSDKGLRVRLAFPENRRA